MQKLTKNQLNIIKLNNKTYIPFQLHQLPDNYNDIPLSEQFSLKGYTYINLTQLKSFNKSLLTFNKDLPQRYKSSK